ncbi:hypothetical protein [Rhodococcus baikonurensis]|uniref:Uncharacterized protein n=1 Tax=Rhodococcus baikonurensis TaxID=172041 RepID=A0ABV5XC05_9NOCA
MINNADKREVTMAVKRIFYTCLGVLVVGLILSVTSLTFVNNAVELGFLTGVGGRKLFEIPFSGGVGIGTVNLLPVGGLLVTIGSAVNLLAGIPWANGTDETELKL